jgi:hypothetical protein
MKIKVEDKTIVRRYITIGDGTMEIWEFADLIDAVSTCDGFIERLVIYNGKMAAALEKEGFVSRNARGSYGYGDKEKLEKLRNIVWKAMEEKNISKWEKGKRIKI